MDIKIEPKAAERVIVALMKQQGGLASMATGQVPAIVTHWSNQGISLYVDEHSALGRALISQGVIKP